MAPRTLTKAALRHLAEELDLDVGPAPAHARRLAVSADRDADVTLAPTLIVAPAPGLADDARRRVRHDAGRLLARTGGGQVEIAVHSDDHWIQEIHSDPPPPTTARIQAVAPGLVQWIAAPQTATVLAEPGASVVAGQTLVEFFSGEAGHGNLHEVLAAVHGTEIWGVTSDRERLLFLLADPLVAAGAASPAMRAAPLPEPDLLVIAPGMQTTIQAMPGRLGWWEVGVPPSGPMDDLALRLGNAVLGNPPKAAGLECTMSGPTLRFSKETVICLSGARMPAAVDGVAMPWATPVTIPAGATLRLGTIQGPGLRTYVCIQGGLAGQSALGSVATFTLGGFGGHHGRALVAGDRLHRAGLAPTAPQQVEVPPPFTRTWTIGVLEGPHGDPEFLTAVGLDALAEATWTVSPQSNRTGVRLIGPKPLWARQDGGEAGLHPSNIHDVPYAFAAIDLTGDLPVVLGPDGPSLGGFVCPFVVAQGERWKLGQLAPGDRVRLRVIDAATAARLRKKPAGNLPQHGEREPPVRHRLAATASRPEVTWRRAGDDFLLVEYGPMTLDLELRLRVHQLQRRLRSEAIAGVIDLVPGIRSLQIHYDPERLDEDRLLARLIAIEDDLPATAEAVVPSRLVHLPLSWEDPAALRAIRIYQQTVHPEAPWCPSNIEFIRRINGLADHAEVQRIVFAADYLVLGLGDVYLGAPVATPVDPRHRLVTTKYNPARTWTPANAVGIGGAYLCVYGMEGPGGYQLVGRTVQVWDTWRRFAGTDAPWLLTHFDRIRFHPISAEELLRRREELPRGDWLPRIEDGEFRCADHRRMLIDQAESIAKFTRTRETAFAAERERWKKT